MYLVGVESNLKSGVCSTSYGGADHSCSTGVHICAHPQRHHQQSSPLLPTSTRLHICTAASPLLGAVAPVAVRVHSRCGRGGSCHAWQNGMARSEGPGGRRRGHRLCAWLFAGAAAAPGSRAHLQVRRGRQRGRYSHAQVRPPHRLSVRPAAPQPRHLCCIASGVPVHLRPTAQSCVAP